MHIIKSLVIILILYTSTSAKSYSNENKILFKVNNKIITSLDIINEIEYLKAINSEFEKIEAKQSFEISKNSLVREKIKELELLKLLDEIKIEEQILNNIIISYFKRLGVNSKKDFEEYFLKRNIQPSVVKKKISIEILWNQLIYNKFGKNIKIDRKAIRKNLINKKSQKEFLLSEILFNIKNKDNLNKKFYEIKKMIKDKGFAQAALIYSISDTAKNAGNLGWINETSLNQKILIELLNIGESKITNPILIPGGFLILKVEDRRQIERELDLDNEIQSIVKDKTNKQLNQFSVIYFNKIKNNIKINEL